MARWNQDWSGSLTSSWPKHGAVSSTRTESSAGNGWHQYAGFSTMDTGHSTLNAGYSTSGISGAVHSSWGALPPVSSGLAPSSGGRGPATSSGGRGPIGEKFSAYDTRHRNQREFFRDNREKYSERGIKRQYEDDKQASENKRPRTRGREGREPELNLFIDKKFTYWNLPAKAKVLLVSNIPQVLDSPDRLYNLFSLYGDVDKIKYVRRKTDCALIEFSTSTFAAIARDHLDNFVFEGRKLVVTLSRFDRVRLPQEMGVYNDHNTKDFTGPEYQVTKRYSSEDLKKGNMKKIMKPTDILHINGIEGTTSPNMLKGEFAQEGINVVDCFGAQMRRSKRAQETGSRSLKMFCFVKFSSVDQAVIALALFGNSRGMRLSFSDSTIEELKKSYAAKETKILTGDQTACDS